MPSSLIRFSCDLKSPFSYWFREGDAPRMDISFINIHFPTKGQLLCCQGFKKITWWRCLWQLKWWQLWETILSRQKSLFSMLFHIPRPTHVCNTSFTGRRLPAALHASHSALCHYHSPIKQAELVIIFWSAKHDEADIAWVLESRSPGIILEPPH